MPIEYIGKAANEAVTELSMTSTGAPSAWVAGTAARYRPADLGSRRAAKSGYS